MNRYYFLLNGGIWSSLMSEEQAKRKNAVEAKDDEDALKKLLPVMVAQMYRKTFHNPTLDSCSLDLD